MGPNGPVVICTFESEHRTDSDGIGRDSLSNASGAGAEEEGRREGEERGRGRGGRGGGLESSSFFSFFLFFSPFSPTLSCPSARLATKSS